MPRRHQNARASQQHSRAQVREARQRKIEARFARARRERPRLGVVASPRLGHRNSMPVAQYRAAAVAAAETLAALGFGAPHPGLNAAHQGAHPEALRYLPRGWARSVWGVPLPGNGSLGQLSQRDSFWRSRYRVQADPRYQRALDEHRQQDLELGMSEWEDAS